uniref:Uncharacterized protein n=1 Tax=Arundo donax TaxID=35708 RepID=A0A0A8YIH5_ARUDO
MNRLDPVNRFRSATNSFSFLAQCSFWHHNFWLIPSFNPSHRTVACYFHSSRDFSKH